GGGVREGARGGAVGWVRGSVACLWGPARSLLPGRLPLLAFYLVTCLLTGQLLGARRSGALDCGPDYREDRALQRGGGKDLTPASPGINGLRRLVMARRKLPHLLDDR